MENWIGVGIWIVMGGLTGLVMRLIIRHPGGAPGHDLVLVSLGAFAAVVGGMLGVGIFSFHDPIALSAGGLGGALALAAVLTATYRWGIRAWL
jgi:hypothetical protein